MIPLLHIGYMPEGSEPWLGSVNPNSPTIRHLQVLEGIFFVGSRSHIHKWETTSDPCTEAVDLTPLSPRSSSCIINP